MKAVEIAIEPSGRPHSFEDASETALLSEKALAEDWNRLEEEAAWAYLQPLKSS